MIAATIALAALVHGIAAYGGALLGAALCRGVEPFDDGPAAMRPRAWAFAVLGAVLGAALGSRNLSPALLGTDALVAGALAGCAYADLLCGIVPDLLTLVPLVALVVSGALNGNAVPAFGAVVAAGPFAGAAFFSKGRGMGWGDVKLAALAGAALGGAGATLALALACVGAFAVARVARVTRPIAFAPYLAAAIGGGLLFVTRI